MISSTVSQTDLQQNKKKPVTLIVTLDFLSKLKKYKYTLCRHTHTHPFNGPLSGTTQVSWYQKGKTNLDFTGARDSEWQWHQLGHASLHLTPDR